MNLFQQGEFRLHSGGFSRWKIDCDALTDDDLATLAKLAAVRITKTFGKIIGIPSGGLRFAHALTPYITSGSAITLIVDDVLTTGESMRAVRNKNPDSWGLVIFARQEPPSWINALFVMGL